ncbi:NYN domain-containing protein [Corynebacterium sp. zg254]|uniref:NYN domain-containing protein n=1 Tax=Corynebacterium zhongnanshanii TaxID=2768834 RepID=A0ABQ6VFP9_9CORY|nr:MULTISPECIES: NYN domain-containing protein [Corynebacterium]KAB3519275.1 NYN domain-containing protein [Corynebacterium zhongnanshanii]MCR5915131.1 NYN domain-containing protein [Corynebacterium sp. zg254]
MLERTQIYVDTSYLLASFYNSWNIGARSQLEIDLPEVVCTLKRMATEHLKQPVHRQLWYDGVPEAGPHRYQRSLRAESGVQFRPGQLIEWGDRRTQKAVDTRLVADMVMHSMRGTTSDMILLSGDADMLPGVEEATNNGVRVHLYGFGWDSMSSALRFACDSVTILDPREDFRDTMRLEIIDEPVIPEGADEAEALIADNFADQDTTDGDGGTAESSSSSSPSSTAFSAPRTATAENPEDSLFDGQTPPPVIEKPLGDAEKPEEPGPSPIPMPTHYGADTSRTAPVRAEAASQASAQQAAPQESTAEQNSAAEPSSTAEQESAAQQNNAAQQATQQESPGREEAARDERPASDINSGSTGTSPSPADMASKKVEPSGKSSGSTRPNPGMMARHRKLRSRYVPLPSEVWAAAGSQNAFDIGEQYAVWWWEHGAEEHQIDDAHLLTGGGLPPEIDRPLLQFACETLHEYTLSENQRVGLRDGFHSGIRNILIKNPLD